MNTPRTRARRTTAGPRRGSSRSAAPHKDVADAEHGDRRDHKVLDLAAETGTVENTPDNDVFADLIDEAPNAGGAARQEYLPTRGYLVMRQAFVQRRQNAEGTVERPSTLGAMVGDREFRAILLYLLLLAFEPLLASDRRLPLRTIANMLATADSPCTVRQARHAIEALRRRDLLRVVERGRTMELIPLLEDGSREDWAQPTGEDDDPDLRLYMTVPHELFTDEVLDQLHLPGLAVLLVALKETTVKDVFAIAVERFQEWYGFSERTAERGYRELEKADLVRVHRQYVRDSRMPRGVKARYHRTLLGPFGTQARRDAQVRAQAARRATASTPSPS